MRSLNDALLSLSLFLLANLTGLALPVHASSTVGELSDVQAETVLAEAKVRLEEARSKLQGRNVTLEQGMTISSTLPPAEMSLPAPVVRTIYGSGGKMTASFLFAGGYEADAGQGQDLPGGYRVESISLDKVLLSKDGKRFPVGFSNTAPTVESTPQGLAMPIAPALPGAVPGQMPPSTYYR